MVAGLWVSRQTAQACFTLFLSTSYSCPGPSPLGPCSGPMEPSHSCPAHCCPWAGRSPHMVCVPEVPDTKSGTVPGLPALSCPRGYAHSGNWKGSRGSRGVHCLPCPMTRHMCPTGHVTKSQGGCLTFAVFCHNPSHHGATRKASAGPKGGSVCKTAAQTSEEQGHEPQSKSGG